MALGGATFDFVNRSRQNRELLKANRNRRARMKEMYANSVCRHPSFAADEKIPAEELAKIKDEIRRNMRREARSSFIWAAVICLAVVVAGFFLIRMLI